LQRYLNCAFIKTCNRIKIISCQQYSGFNQKSVSLWLVNKNMKKILLLLITVLQLSACNQASKKVQPTIKSVNVPTFSADSAYKYVQQQVDFGPRIPNTKEHLACANYLSATLKRFGAEVMEQKATLMAFDGTLLNAINIIGSFNTKAQKRVLLFAHWDTRPWADHDKNPNNHKKPILGANDGASGVGVLLEMARQFQIQQPNIGVDIIFFDAEDYGATEEYSGENTEDSWCLGTQYWAKNPHETGYRAEYGILLDMVGGKQATFYREQISEYYAMDIVNKVWSKAKSLGFAHYFIDQKGGAITDDHLYVNKIAGIPSIDIIQYDPNTDSGFAHYWHTVDDTMENIDKNTLNAVGTTVMHVVYNE